MKPKLKHIVITIIIIIIFIFADIFLQRTYANTKVGTKNTYFSHSLQFQKKKKAKKKVKKSKKKKVKKSKKKTTYKTSYVATASRQTYYNYAQSVSGYDNTQMGCLINLWQRESGWNANSRNKKTGACGIPQAYPCSKIKAQQGSNNWKAQIRWGINYINYKYKSPCNAWNNFRKKGWY